MAKNFKNVYDRAGSGRNTDKTTMDAAKSFVGVVSDWDPTGISTIVKAFMYNQCDVSRLGRRKKKLRNHKKH
jgi:hypothetical protein